MCGISGVFSTHQKYHQKTEQSIKSLFHRGPDNTSVEIITPELSFAHSRLSIVDLNTRSHQPMTDNKTGNKIILNGEIYNFKELKKELKNEHFKTSSDTEVLLLLLREKNYKEALSLCNGAFAFAFWDNVNKKLVLGRDRFGKKPLFYTIYDNSLFFASEAKALFSYGIEKKVNHKAVLNYLFESTIGANRYSFFENINQVENSHFYVFGKNNNSIVQEQKTPFWKPPTKNIKINYHDAVEQFKDLLIDAVKIRLSDEVNFAVMLSGGLDSSAITSVAAKYNSDRKITAISAVYPNSEFDESAFARTVTDKYKNLDTIWVDDVNYNNFLKNIKNVTWHQEIPVPDGSIVAQSILMQRIAEKDIKVVLSGIGGDEVLAGYPNIFYPAQVANELKKLNLKHISLRAVYHSFPNSIKNYIYIQKHKNLAVLKNTDVLQLFDSRFEKKYKHQDRLNEYLIHSLLKWTVPNMVWFEDRSSMTSSVENRSPLLDYRIADFLLSLPGSFKINRTFTKQILRDAVKDVLPEEIRNRKAKQGFHAPIKDWKESMTFDFFTDEKFQKTFNYLNFDAVKNAPFNLFWRTYALHVWHNVFF